MNITTDPDAPLEKESDVLVKEEEFPSDEEQDSIRKSSSLSIIRSDDLSSDEFFDRERWHDVEGDAEPPVEPPDSKAASGLSLLSFLILTLVALSACLAGVLSVMIFNQMAAWIAPVAPTPPDYRTTPAFWIGYSPEHVVFYEAFQPSCFTSTREGMFVIGDEQPPSLRLHTIHGVLLRTIVLKESAKCLAIGEENTLFPNEILVVQGQELSFYSMEGEKKASWPLPSDNADVRSLALSDRFVFAADSRNRVVYRFDETGSLTGSIGRVEPSHGGAATKQTQRDSDDDTDGGFHGFVVMQSPITLTVSPKTGLLHVANPGRHRIEVFTQDGYWEPSLCWGTGSAELAGFAGCCNPTSILALEDGRIVTAEKSVTRVKVYFPDGKLDRIVAGPELLDTKPGNIPQINSLPFRTINESNEKPVFISYVGKDSILVCDPVFHVVRYFTPIHRESSEDPR